MTISSALLSDNLSRFNLGEPYIEQFWDIVKNFPVELQKKFMSFVTGSDRIPSTGIETMKFKISDLQAVRLLSVVRYEG